jgi:hypothetical protein
LKSRRKITAKLPHSDELVFYLTRVLIKIPLRKPIADSRIDHGTRSKALLTVENFPGSSSWALKDYETYEVVVRIEFNRILYIGEKLFNLFDFPRVATLVTRHREELALGNEFTDTIGPRFELGFAHLLMPFTGLQVPAAGCSNQPAFPIASCSS